MREASESVPIEVMLANEGQAVLIGHGKKVRDGRIYERLELLNLGSSFLIIRNVSVRKGEIPPIPMPHETRPIAPGEVLTIAGKEMLEAWDQFLRDNAYRLAPDSHSLYLRAQNEETKNLEVEHVTSHGQRFLTFDFQGALNTASVRLWDAP